MRVRRLVMLRHGQTNYNAGSRMQGQLDTELSDLGRDQAVAAAEVLAKRQPLVIVSSDLRRALDTAVALAERSGQPVLVDTRLRETHLGDWQGMTHLEVDAAAPDARMAWRDDARWAPHGGESRVDVAARGIHVDAIGCVVHFDPPGDAKDYVHRSGRTARAGAVGTVVSLVATEEQPAVRALQRQLGLEPRLRSPNDTAASRQVRPAPRRNRRRAS